MKLKISLWLSLMGALCQGCSPFVNSVRTMIIEPYQYCRRCVSWHEIQENAELANASWAEFAGAHAEIVFSEDFAKGYKYGFADYLFAGGTGNPPPLPPRCYWGIKYENPEGHAKIKDWFDGFRKGATAAIDSGIRKWVVVPASTALPIRPPQMFAGGTSPWPEDVLPAPKEVPPGPDPKKEPVPPPAEPGKKEPLLPPKDAPLPADPSKKKDAAHAPKELPPAAPGAMIPLVAPQPNLSSGPGKTTWQGVRETPPQTDPLPASREAAEQLFDSQPVPVLVSVEPLEKRVDLPFSPAVNAPEKQRNVLPPREPAWNAAGEQRVVLPPPPEPLPASNAPAEQRSVLPPPPEPLPASNAPAAQRTLLPPPPEPLPASNASAEQRSVLPPPPDPLPLSPKGP